jgi:ADP-glucose pyrophosphorylase
MVKRIVGSTSSTSNVHRVVDDNSNLNRNIIMDAMRINQGHVVQCSIIDEKSNADTTRVFLSFKRF